MQKLVTTILMLLLFVVGCTDQTSITSPDSSIQKLGKSPDNPLQEPNWITLPSVPGADGSTIIHYSVSKNIEGNKGGELKLKEEYPGGPFGKVKIEAKLKFPKNAFDGDKFIEMKIGQSFGSTTFSPHSEFNHPAEYDLKYEGLDLTGMVLADIDFVYLNEDGSYESVIYDEIKLDVQKGKIEIKKALLPHFSRYSFVR